MTGDGEKLPEVTRLAAYAVVGRGDRQLLCRIAPGYPAAGRWTLPGGGVEFGEDPAVAVLREIEEETGLIGRIVGPVRVLNDTGVWQRRDGPVRYHHVRFVYRVEVVGGDERLEVGGSTDAFGWFRADEIERFERTSVVDEAGPG